VAYILGREVFAKKADHVPGKSMNIDYFHAKIRPHFRKKRMMLFAELLHPTSRTRILDVGGYEGNWHLLDVKPEVTLLNIDVKKDETHGRFRYVKGDGRKLQYPDKSFDIVYSNSVIEHVGGFEEQKAFAKEIARVGKSYFVQTPDKKFPVEPHFIAPFIHYLPKETQIKLARRLTVWGLITKPSPEAVKDLVESLHLLTRQELKLLFPGAQLISERVLGLSKSLLAYSVAT
jgi:ubiquinone/menaquinone biosynthesis C-methylase UbiE